MNMSACHKCSSIENLSDLRLAGKKLICEKCRSKPSYRFSPIKKNEKWEKMAKVSQERILARFK